MHLKKSFSKRKTYDKIGLCIVKLYFLRQDQWIAGQLITVKIFPVKIRGVYLAVVVSGVVIDSPAGVAAGRIDGDLVFSVF